MKTVANRGKARVMLVDDDRLVLATIKQGLVERGYQVETFDNGIDAIEAYSTHAPDIAILDVRMPKITGPETAKAMLALACRPIIMLSAHEDHDIVREAVSLGVCGYLVKPIEVAQLVPSIEAALARFAEVNALVEEGANLREAVEKNRVISTAVGIMMERCGVNHDIAFETLRGLARRRRQSLRDLAHELVDALSAVNSIAKVERLLE